MSLDRDLGRSGLPVPQREIAEIDAAALPHRREKILDRRGAIVVAGDIGIHAAAESVRPSSVWIMRMISAPLL